MSVKLKFMSIINIMYIYSKSKMFYIYTDGDKGGGVGSRFMRGKTAISHFTGKKLVISRNLMNSFLTV